jgi:ubiquitin carboxyl-terminal hydrolase 8
MAFLLDGIHEDLNRAKDDSRYTVFPCDGTTNTADAQEAWTCYQLRNDSIVVDNFQGQKLCLTTCSNCKIKSVSFDTSMEIQLPFDKSTDSTTLKHLLEAAFTGIEQLDKSWRCSTCRHDVSAGTQQRKLWRTSEILVVQLVRFKFVSENGGEIHKLSNLVQFSLDEVDFSPYFALDSPFKDCSKYRLYAVSNHSGNVDKGHYWAYCRPNDGSQWVEFDDDKRVRNLNPDDIVSNHAYMLFFRRVSSTASAVASQQAASQIPSQQSINMN